MSDDDDRLVPITVKHDDLVEFAKTAAAVIENPNRPDWLRADAREFYDQLSECLLYKDDPSKRVRLRWLSFGVRDFYRDLVAEALDRLGDGVKDQPAQVHCAKMAAEICDNTSYSNDFRCSALTALREVMKSLEPQGLSVVE